VVTHGYNKHNWRSNWEPGKVEMTRCPMDPCKYQKEAKANKEEGKRFFFFESRIGEKYEDMKS